MTNLLARLNFVVMSTDNPAKNFIELVCKQVNNVNCHEHTFGQSVPEDAILVFSYHRLAPGPFVKEKLVSGPLAGHGVCFPRQIPEEFFLMGVKRAVCVMTMHYDELEDEDKQDVASTTWKMVSRIIHGEPKNKQEEEISQMWGCEQALPEFSIRSAIASQLPQVAIGEQATGFSGYYGSV